MFGREQRNLRTAREHIATLRADGESDIIVIKRATSGVPPKRGGSGVEPAVIAVTDAAVYRSTGGRSVTTVRYPIDVLALSVSPYQVAGKSIAGSLIRLVIDAGRQELGYITGGSVVALTVTAATDYEVCEPIVLDEEDGAPVLINALAFQFKKAQRPFELG